MTDQSTVGSDSPNISGNGNAINNTKIIIESAEKEFVMRTETFSFLGSDTLTIATLMNEIHKINPSLESVSVNVDGYDFRRNAKATYQVSTATAEIVGYIRRLCIETPDGDKLTVGGVNATAEDIAAKSIEIVVSDKETREALVRNSRHGFGAYLLPDIKTSRERKTYHEMIKLLLLDYNINLVIAYAKRTRDAESLQYLVEHIEKTMPPKDAEILTEAFRMYEDARNIDHKYKSMAISALYRFVKKFHRNFEYINACIYAIESIGALGGSDERLLHVARSYLFQVYKLDFIPDSNHPKWAACVALVNCSAGAVEREFQTILKYIEETSLILGFNLPTPDEYVKRKVR